MLFGCGKSIPYPIPGQSLSNNSSLPRDKEFILKITKRYTHPRVFYLDASGVFTLEAPRYFTLVTPGGIPLPYQKTLLQVSAGVVVEF
jgi:hypothetical protein